MESSDARHARSDDETGQLAQEVRDRVRDLNHATMGAPGLTLPGTVYTVLGALAGAAHGLDQLTEQLEDFLGRQMEAGRLGHDRGLPPESSVRSAQSLLTEAGWQAERLSQTLAEAQGEINAIHAVRPAGAVDAEFPQPVTDVLHDPTGPAPPGSVSPRVSGGPSRTQ
ncbi:hypothetical protein J4573_08355 [Actinomadura barringtoniae]|uniref:Uncharacterized protein n=1 Tax=Actinomadura barringtoniae TaxID=1427535 RepID=A0A939T5H2_9ACTN|nr:hypothetical protein [Actinomadura barringtoniae]MBO2447097.1 hypothetical protein [Actinomadura barringtoniae]